MMGVWTHLIISWKALSKVRECGLQWRSLGSCWAAESNDGVVSYEGKCNTKLG